MDELGEIQAFSCRAQQKDIGSLVNFLSWRRHNTFLGDCSYCYVALNLLTWKYTEVHGVMPMLFLLLGWLFCFQVSFHFLERKIESSKRFRVFTTCLQTLMDGVCVVILVFIFQNGWLTQLFDHDKTLLTTDSNLTSRQWRWLVWFRSHTSRNAIVVP